MTSPEQSALHLEVSSLSPSSQNSSGETTFESPHYVLQIDIDPTELEQYHPSSGPEQSYLHILLSSVEIPSSQDSSPARIPSLHTVTQFEGVEGLPPVHDQPETFPEQSAIHFEVPSVSPSSQISYKGTTLESPQIGLHVEIFPIMSEQYHPTSGPEQSNLHLILSSAVIPSSHTSETVQIPSLQFGVQDDGLPIQVNPGSI